MGNPSYMSSASTLKWPSQAKPSPLVWNLWRRANLLWSDPSGNLSKPLGKWLYPAHDQRQVHFAYKFSGNVAIRIGTDNEYQICKRMQGSKYCESLGRLKWSDHPVSAIPAEAEMTSAPLIWKATGVPSVPTNPRPYVPSDYEEYVRTLPSLMGS